MLTGVENITGSNAADRLTGDANANTLLGGNGADMIEGGAGADQLNGGLGRDTLSYAGSAAGVTVNLAAKTAAGGDAAGDVISGFENLTGSRFADTLTGSGGANLLTGGNGNDVLNGGGGSDILKGGMGADKLLGGIGKDRFYGGAGKDSYTGGAGADTFYFSKITEAGKGISADTITDFTTKIDKINLSVIDADTLTSGNQSFTYIGSQVFHHTAGELRYDKVAGIISGDVNGDGAADFQIKLLPGKIMAGGDFIL